MTRLYVRLTLIEQGLTDKQLAHFDALTQEQFELWYETCFKSTGN